MGVGIGRVQRSKRKGRQSGTRQLLRLKSHQQHKESVHVPQLRGKRARERKPVYFSLLTHRCSFNREKRRLLNMLWVISLSPSLSPSKCVAASVSPRPFLKICFVRVCVACASEFRNRRRVFYVTPILLPPQLGIVHNLRR